MGEGRNQKLSVAVERSVADEAALVLDTFGGKLHVKFDHTASVTMLGQLPFFVELLQASGLYERWIKSAALHYSSPNAHASMTCWARCLSPHSPGCAATATSTRCALMASRQGSWG